MRIVSKIDGGPRRPDGSLLVRKGENDIAEPLSFREREYITVLVKSRLAEIVSEPVPDGPVSETRLTIIESSNGAPIRVRRARRKTKGKAAG